MGKIASPLSPLSTTPATLAARDHLQPTMQVAWSDQQLAVFDWCRSSTGHGFVEALAGTGKTTTLLGCCDHMRDQSIALLAFNRSIANEISGKVHVLGMRHVHARTFHSVGMRAWLAHAPHATVDDRGKRRSMLDKCQVPSHLRQATVALVSLAKQYMVNPLAAIVAGDGTCDDGLAPGMVDYRDLRAWRHIIDHHDIALKIEGRDYHNRSNIDTLVQLAIVCLTWSAEVGKHIIDFDDMLWLPLIYSCSLPTFDRVLVDEAQDTNRARHMFVLRMIGDSGRALFVGDRHQAIFGFTGADSSAVDTIVSEFDCHLLPLTVSYRCSKAATALAQRWVPEIQAHDSNAIGSVEHVSARQFRANHIPQLTPGVDAIICRINRPLVQLALELIRMGVPAHVEGRDIGKSLDRLAARWQVATCAELITELEEYRRIEVEKLLARDAMHMVEALDDRLQTLVVLMDGCEYVSQLRDRIASIFDDTATIDGRGSGGASGALRVVLSSVHKAKGREWSRVWLLGYGTYMPSTMARQEWQMAQENNLCYVAVTRTKDKLYLLQALDNRDDSDDATKHNDAN